VQNSTLPTNALGRVSWKYYNKIKRKAIDKEFFGKTEGLLISLSITFFIVIICAYALNFAYKSITAAKNHEKFLERKVYYLEDINHINTQAMKEVNKSAGSKVMKLNLA
jgi:hypothetical protein